MKLCYIDVETGGLDCDSNPLLQLSGIIEVDDKEVDKFDWYIQPFIYDKLDPIAMQMLGLDPAVDDRFLNPKDVIYKFTSLLDDYVDKYDKKDKFFFVGYNSHSFDMPFVRKFFEKNKHKFFGSYFFYPSIDVMLLYGLLFMDRRTKMENFKLITVAKEAGLEIDEEKFHDGMYDIFITKQLYKKAQERISK